MKLISKIKEKLMPWKKKKRLHDERLLKLDAEGKYLRVDVDIDNKELMQK